jgi:hypothetical protein
MAMAMATATPETEGDGSGSATTLDYEWSNDRQQYTIEGKVVEDWIDHGPMGEEKGGPAGHHSFLCLPSFPDLSPSF